MLEFSEIRDNINFKCDRRYFQYCTMTQEFILLYSAHVRMKFVYFNMYTLCACVHNPLFFSVKQPLLCLQYWFQIIEKKNLFPGNPQLGLVILGLNQYICPCSLQRSYPQGFDLKPIDLSMWLLQDWGVEDCIEGTHCGHWHLLMLGGSHDRKWFESEGKWGKKAEGKITINQIFFKNNTI